VREGGVTIYSVWVGVWSLMVADQSEGQAGFAEAQLTAYAASGGLRRRAVSMSFICAHAGTWL
jgi:hypothetical protein